MSSSKKKLFHSVLRAAVLTLCVATGADVMAATVLNAPTSKPRARAPEREAGLAKAPQAVGRIQSLDMEQGRLTMNGTLYTFTPGALVVVNKATPGGTRTLARGQLVLLVATAPDTPNEVAQAWIIGK